MKNPSKNDQIIWIRSDGPRNPDRTKLVRFLVRTSILDDGPSSPKNPAEPISYEMFVKINFWFVCKYNWWWTGRRISWNRTREWSWHFNSNISISISFVIWNQIQSEIQAPISSARTVRVWSWVIKKKDFRDQIKSYLCLWRKISRNSVAQNSAEFSYLVFTG